MTCRKKFAVTMGETCFFIVVFLGIWLTGCASVGGRHKVTAHDSGMSSPAVTRLIHNLAAQLQSDSHQDTFRGAEFQDQDEAAQQLLALGEDGVRVLLQALKNGNENGKIAAAKALSGLKPHPRICQALEEVLRCGDTSRLLAQWVRASLCRVGCHYEYHFANLKECLSQEPKVSVTDITGRVWCPFWETLWATAFVGDDNALEVVQDTLQKYGKDADPRCYPGLLGDTRNPKATHHLLAQLNDVLAYYRASGKKDPNLAEEWKEDMGTRQLLLAIGKCGGKDAIKALKNLVESPNPMFSNNDLALALGEIGGSEAFKLLCKLIDDDKFELGCNPYVSLRHFSAREASPVLMKIIEKWEKKPEAAKYIISDIVDYSRTVRDETLVPVLEKAYVVYSDSQPGILDTFIHMEIASQLYFIDTPSALAALKHLAALEDSVAVPPLLMLARDGLRMRNVTSDLLYFATQVKDAQELKKCITLIIKERFPLPAPWHNLEFEDDINDEKN